MFWGFSFLLPEQKKRNKDELLRTMSEKNSPSALFGLLRQVFPLNKKNSLRSNSFLFFTLQHSPPLHAQKVRPDLSAFFAQHRFARWGVVFSFIASLVGVWCFLFLLRSFLSSRAEQSVVKDLENTKYRNAWAISVVMIRDGTLEMLDTRNF